MKVKYIILTILILFSGKGFCQQDDESKFGKVMDSLKEKMYIDEALNNDSALKYSRLCLAINKKMAEADFIDYFPVLAFFNKKEYDSAYMYGIVFLKRKYKKDDDIYSGYGEGRNMQLRTSEMLYSIDTARHNYKEALKLLLTHNPNQWWFGSATGFRNRMKLYYTNIMSCYMALGKSGKVNKYRRKLEDEDYD